MNKSFVDLRLVTQKFSHPCVQIITMKMWMLVYFWAMMTPQTKMLALAFGVYKVNWKDGCIFVCCEGETIHPQKRRV